MSFFTCSFLIVSSVLAIFVVNDCRAVDDQPRMHMNFDAKVTKADFLKCVEESGVTLDELKVFFVNSSKEPTKKYLCHLKCMAAASGVTDKNGMVDTDLLKKEAPSSLDEATLNSTLKCMEAIGKVSTCQDMDKVRKCMPKLPE